MGYYSDNKAKLATYQCSVDVKGRIADLFYYCGYNCEGEEQIPDLNSRFWFNYIQCSPIFEKPIPADYIADISARYQQGVTIYHQHVQPLTGEYIWNFEQTEENAEVDDVWYDISDIQLETNTITFKCKGNINNTTTKLKLRLYTNNITFTDQEVAVTNLGNDRYSCVKPNLSNVKKLYLSRVAPNGESAKFKYVGGLN